MAACEKCWAIYQERYHAGQDVTYGDVVRELDGQHTAKDQCGDLHLMCVEVNRFTKRCRCGEREYTDTRAMVNEIANRREAKR